MKVKSVRYYRTPRYPAKLRLLSNPALLRQNLPPAWRAVPQLAGAVALFLSVNTTLCRGADKGAGAAGVAVVAPIFEHGEGRGVAGCVVVSPPVFLSEEEALQIIREELSQSGVKASETNFAVPGMKIRPTRGKFQKPLQASAADPGKKVAVKFVSHQNCHELGAPVSSLSVESYDLKAVANSMAAVVREQGEKKIYFGAFYDPVAGRSDWRALHSALQSKAKTEQEQKAIRQSFETEWKAESKRLLRLQVQDFIKWLQAQGAI